MGGVALRNASAEKFQEVDKISDTPLSGTVDRQAERRDGQPGRRDKDPQVAEARCFRPERGRKRAQELAVDCGAGGKGAWKREGSVRLNL